MLLQPPRPGLCQQDSPTLDSVGTQQALAPPQTFRVFSAAGSQPIPWPRSCTSHVPSTAPCEAAIGLIRDWDWGGSCSVPPGLPQMGNHRQEGLAAPSHQIPGWHLQCHHAGRGDPGTTVVAQPSAAHRAE